MEKAFRQDPDSCRVRSRTFERMNNMERLTKRENPDNSWWVESTAVERTEFGYSGTAIERLAKFEDILEAVLEEQGRLGPKLEQMRIDGKTHSYQFKEMMGKS